MGGAVAAVPGPIGPNAIVRTIEALRELEGPDATERLLGAAGLIRYVEAMPVAMVPERDVTALHDALRERFGPAEAERVARLSGIKTADYLLAHRIPKAAQAVLRWLPARVAAPMLLSSIAKHTWTFAGSASVVTAAGPPLRITIAGCPICRGARSAAPACAYYAASFERLFRALVSPHARIAEVRCEARGDGPCVFQLDYDG